MENVPNSKRLVNRKPLNLKWQNKKLSLVLIKAAKKFRRLNRNRQQMVKQKCNDVNNFVDPRKSSKLLLGRENVMLE